MIVVIIKGNIVGKNIVGNVEKKCTSKYQFVEPSTLPKASFKAFRSTMATSGYFDFLTVIIHMATRGCKGHLNTPKLLVPLGRTPFKMNLI